LFINFIVFEKSFNLSGAHLFCDRLAIIILVLTSREVVDLNEVTDANARLT
jgi:hypothetical protein